jgi:hypothetical protein
LAIFPVAARFSSEAGEEPASSGRPAAAGPGVPAQPRGAGGRGAGRPQGPGALDREAAPRRLRVQRQDAEGRGCRAQINGVAKPTTSLAQGERRGAKRLDQGCAKPSAVSVFAALSSRRLEPRDGWYAWTSTCGAWRLGRGGTPSNRTASGSSIPDVGPHDPIPSRCLDSPESARPGPITAHATSTAFVSFRRAG